LAKPSRRWGCNGLVEGSAVSTARSGLWVGWPMDRASRVAGFCSQLAGWREVAVGRLAGSPAERRVKLVHDGNADPRGPKLGARRG